MYKYFGIDSCKGFSYRKVHPRGKQFVSWSGKGYSVIHKFFAKISGTLRDNHQGFKVSLTSPLVVDHVFYYNFFIYFSDGRIVVSASYEEKN